MARVATAEYTSGSRARGAVVAQACLAAFMGLALFAAVAFAAPAAIHGAAHDSRHGMALPCH